MSTSTALIKAASTAVSNKVIQQTTAKAVKAAAPVIAKAAIATANMAVSRTRSNRSKAKTAATSTTRRSRTFAPVSYSTEFANSSKVVRIQQSEVIGELNPGLKKSHWWSPNPSVPQDFSLAVFPISPSNKTTFPWLSNVAGLFDKFRFRNLSFSFITNRPTNTKGNVTMAVDYDAYDSAPSSVIDMSNLAKFTSSPVYINKTLTVPISHPGSRTWYFCDDGSSGDKKTYNLANVYVALNGAADANSHGYIVVNYDVELVDKNPNLRVVQTSISESGITSTSVIDSSDEDPAPSPDPEPEIITVENKYSMYGFDMPSAVFAGLTTGFTDATTATKVTFTGLKAGERVAFRAYIHDLTNDLNPVAGGIGTGVLVGPEHFTSTDGYLTGSGHVAHLWFVGTAVTDNPEILVSTAYYSSTDFYFLGTTIPVE